MASRINSKADSVRFTGGSLAVNKRASTRFIHVLDDAATGGLPARDGLTPRNHYRGARVALGEVAGHDGRVSGTDVCDVGSLTGLLELGGEYGDCDGNEDSRQGLISGKTVRIKRIPPYQESFPPLRERLHPQLERTKKAQRHTI